MFSDFARRALQEVRLSNRESIRYDERESFHQLTRS
jgi:hypothetical protein